MRRRLLLAVAPVGSQPPVEIGFEHTARIAVGRTLLVEVYQVAVRQTIERAPGETTGQHRAADVTGAVIDPGLQKGGPHLRPLRAARRAEAAGRPVAHGS